MFDQALMNDAALTLASLRARSLTCVTAESCTGGLIAALLTAVAGSSDVVDRGFVTYSNAAKMQMLGVEEVLLATHGAVSAETAAAMAKGALKTSAAQIAVSVTGIAGPGGGTMHKPVGLVYLAVASDDQVRVLECRFGDIGRNGVREKSVIAALRLLREGPC
jgi:nicotinamide-nucleotide amidase